MKIIWENLYNDLAAHVANALREARVRPEQLPFKTDGEILTIPGINDADVESIRTLYNKDNIEAIKKQVADASVEEDTMVVTTPEGEEMVVAKKPRVIKKRSVKYLNLKKQVKNDTLYLIEDAVKLLQTLSAGRKIKTVELHLNTRETGLRGEIKLPHSTGKEVKIAIFGPDVETKINSGSIDFDILLATPKDMAKLARFAKILGPKGLMPNPKNGTVTDNPEKRQAELLSGGTLPYKSEAKFPIIHLALGSINQNQSDLVDNITETIRAIGVTKIKSAFLTGTHTPSIKLSLGTIL